MSAPEKMVACKHMFSNGTEYGLFLETQCLRGCTRYRQHNCRVLNAIERARWVGEEAFPFDDLLEWERYAGKRCRHYTTDPIMHKPRTRRQVEGQTEMEAAVEETR